MANCIQAARMSPEAKRAKDKRVKDKRAKDKRAKDKRAKDKRAKDKRAKDKKTKKTKKKRKVTNAYDQQQRHKKSSAEQRFHWKTENFKDTSEKKAKTQDLQAKLNQDFHKEKMQLKKDVEKGKAACQLAAFDSERKMKFEQSRQVHKLNRKLAHGKRKLETLEKQKAEHFITKREYNKYRAKILKDMYGTVYSSCGESESESESEYESESDSDL